MIKLVLLLIGLSASVPLAAQDDPFDWLSEIEDIVGDDGEDEEDDEKGDIEWPLENEDPDEIRKWEAWSSENEDDTSPEIWPTDIDMDEIDGDGLGDLDWRDWSETDWENRFIDDYKHYYEKKNASKIKDQAYALTKEQGIQVPQRYGPLTYDPEQDIFYFESEAEYTERLSGFLENLEEELTEVGKDLALDLLYRQLEPMLKVLRQKNAALLETILPKMGGIPVWDPAEDQVKEKQEGKHNFKYWIKLAAESIMQNIFKKNAEGKYELQREKIELLKQVGIVRFLKMAVIDWEIMHSFTLEIPDEVLTYAQAIQDIYQSGKTTFQAGKDLYREVITLDTELPIPDQFNQWLDLTHNIATHQLTVAEMVNKRKKVLALTYRQLAKRNREYADDLHGKLHEEGQLKMNEAERIKASQIAGEYLSESIRLMAHAEALLASSYQTSTTAHKDQYALQYALFNRLETLYQK